MKLRASLLFLKRVSYLSDIFIVFYYTASLHYELELAPISEKLKFDKWLDEMKNLSNLAEIKPYVYPNGDE